MQLKKFVAPVAAVAAIGTAVVAPSAIFGTQTNHHFLGYAGGTAIQALGTTVRSDLTSASSVDTNVTGVTNSNTLATAIVPKIATVSGVSTQAKTEDTTGGGSKMTLKAQTAGINLLNGLITASAVTTTDVAEVDGDNNTSGSVDTQILDLKIGNKLLPVTTSKNFHITIPKIANVWVNASFVGPGPAGSGTILTYGAGLFIGLLQNTGDFPTGTYIFVNPVYGAISTVTPVLGASIGGYAYGTKATVAAGSLLNAESGPTAQISQPFNGTNGLVKTNTTATVLLPDLLKFAVVTSTAEGIKSPPNSSYSEMTTKLTGINLLGGVITADALTGVARVEALANGTTQSFTSTSLVNLKILGQPVDINTGVNTVINIANIGKLTIRGEAKNANQALVKVLELKITVANHNLPVGAVIQVGVAAAWDFLPPT